MSRVESVHLSTKWCILLAELGLVQYDYTVCGVAPPVVRIPGGSSQFVELSRTEQSLETNSPARRMYRCQKGDADEIEKRPPSSSWRNELERSRPGSFFPTKIQMNPVKQRSWDLELVRTDHSTTYIQYGVDGREECKPERSGLIITETSQLDISY